MTVPYRMWKMGATAALGATAFTLWSGPAQGFFPPLPIEGPTSPAPVTVLPPPPPAPIVIPVSPNIPVPPPTTPTVPPFVPPPVVPVVPPPPFVPPPVPQTVPPVVPQTVPPPPQHSCCCDGPQTVPEPATLLSAAIGLGLAGGVAWKRRKDTTSDDAGK